MARIVFDLDGTLIDSAPDIHAGANQLLEAEGAEPITLADTRSFIGQGASVFIEKMRAARGIPDSEHARLLAAFVALYETLVTRTEIYPGVVAALEALAAEGHSLGICTNKPLVPCKAVLNHLDLTRFFGVILGGDSLPTHKPDPAPLEAAFAALGDGPEIYVGDSEVDAETARRACVPFLLFTEGYRKTEVEALPHTAAFSDFADLGALVRRLVARAA
ncbi:phosphoglycolate phosphatase [Vannielia litorea]|uniref:phosphoglycolate phosphatase n=1 Tax=Vannielia litorea TaxID=1217970 RepID=UPI001BCFA0B6|nr:phosphoglycolate phosphatase [Vannielia litorea]MBS8226394.1 phosphoglycolate phosphatase [Vannielia litorea]